MRPPLWGAVALLLLVWRLAAHAQTATTVDAQAAPTTAGAVLGLTHVDVVDLHVRRVDGSPPVLDERLGAQALADRYTVASRSGARFHRWSLYWDLVESESTAWVASDGIVARDIQASLSTVMILQGVPLQLREGAVDTAAFEGGGRWRHVGGIRGLHEPAFLGPAGPSDDAHGASGANPANPWAVFVQRVVDRYAPGGSLGEEHDWTVLTGVRYWQIGNEPNDPHFWQGGPIAYARMLEVANLVIKRGDPSAVVLHAGIADTGNAVPWYRTFAGALKARAAALGTPTASSHFFDVASWHAYGAPARITQRANESRAVLAEAGLPAKPVWITEFGLPVWSEYPGPCWDSKSPHRGTLAEQAAYIWQAAAEGIAAGVQGLLYFQLFDDCGNGDTSYDAHGLVRNPAGNQCWAAPGDHACWRLDPALAGTPRPAYAAFAAAARELSGAQPYSAPADGGARRETFLRPPDTLVTVAWAPSAAPAMVRVPAASTGARLLTIRADGTVAETSIAPTGGAYSLVLPGATNTNGAGGSPMAGGLPQMIVESDRLPPATSLEAGEVTSSTVELFVHVSDPLGVAAYRVFQSPVIPSSPEAWLELTGSVPWTGPFTGGRTRLVIPAKAGATLHFAAHARDRGGRWGELTGQPLSVTLPAAPAPPTAAPAAPTTRRPGARFVGHPYF